MNSVVKLLCLHTLLAFTIFYHAQDSLLINLLNQRKYTFNPTGNSFTGKGWKKIDLATYTC